MILTILVLTGVPEVRIGLLHHELLARFPVGVGGVTSLQHPRDCSTGITKLVVDKSVVTKINEFFSWRVALRGVRIHVIVDHRSVAHGRANSFRAHVRCALIGRQGRYLAIGFQWTGRHRHIVGHNTNDVNARRR